MKGIRTEGQIARWEKDGSNKAIMSFPELPEQYQELSVHPAAINAHGIYSGERSDTTFKVVVNIDVVPPEVSILGIVSMSAEALAERSEQV